MKINEQFMEGVVIPVCQSFITAILLGALCWFGLAVADGLHFKWGVLEIPWKTTLLVFFSSMALFWFAFRSNWSQRIDAAYGLVTQSMPEMANETVAVIKEKNTVHLNIYGEHEGQFMDLPCSMEQFVKFSQGVAKGRNLAIDGWSDIFTRTEFKKLRDELISRGYAYWKGNEPRNGVGMNRSLRALCEFVAREYSPTSNECVVKRVKM